MIVLLNTILRMLNDPASTCHIPAGIYSGENIA